MSSPSTVMECACPENEEENGPSLRNPLDLIAQHRKKACWQWPFQPQLGLGWESYLAWTETHPWIILAI